MIRFICTLITLLTLSNISAAKANYNVADAGYKICNHHKFTFLLLKVYDVYLCADDRNYLYPSKIYQSNFSLIINYNMNFERQELAKSSIEEINRYYDVSQANQQLYYKELMVIFPDVRKGDVIEARYSKRGVVEFYHNKQFQGKINEKQFAQIFLDIWLHKDNKYKHMIEDLYE